MSAFDDAYLVKHTNPANSPMLQYKCVDAKNIKHLTTGKIYTGWFWEYATTFNRKTYILAKGDNGAYHNFRGNRFQELEIS